MYPALRLVSNNFSGRGYPESGAPGAKSGNGKQHKSTILVVEDEVLIRLPVAEYLRECGYRVLEASTAAEACAVFASGQPIEVLFSDVSMPGEMNGFGLAQWVRREFPDVQVLLAAGPAQMAKNAEQACSDAPLLTKPYSHSSLLAHIKRMMARGI
jgi:CheY-like chemotaxis protein